MNPKILSVKLLARIHDPGEKLLILFARAHEQGTVAHLKEVLFPQGIAPDIAELAKSADHWAAAADRPQWPKMQWLDQIRFTNEPVLIHPLSGEHCPFEGELRIDLDAIEASSLAHALRLVRRADGGIDHEATAWALWRLLPEPEMLDEPARRQLGQLWGLLPADSRVPDHTIWAHLDLTAGLATAMAADPEGKLGLLLLSIGPVQEFIATARSISDLWAGSHLLSALVFEGMKVILEELGPEAVLFPALRGLPVVDFWLVGKPELDGFDQLKKGWAEVATDSNPLFVATLPNRVLAVVPHGQGEELARRAGERMRTWVREKAEAAFARLLAAAGVEGGGELPGWRQIERHLEGFPEVHWALIPWAQHGCDVSEAAERLERLLGTFYPKEGPRPGFFASPLWRLLEDAGASGFFRPNAGVLYPAGYDLADRAQTAAKSLRPFPQSEEKGYRCSLCGEREWLTDDEQALDLPPGQRKERGTLWLRIAGKKPSWARKGEHLCALCALKRLWPEMWAEEVRGAVSGLESLGRYVVSTHTMAAARDLEALAELPDERVEALAEDAKPDEVPALPAKLAYLRREKRPPARLLARLEKLREDAEGDDEAARAASEKLSALERQLRSKEFLDRRPETYYAAILMDGDRMGAWLSGTGPAAALTYRDFWHPTLRGRIGDLEKQVQDLDKYASAPRAPSPARHMAISEALSTFAVHLVPVVVERLFKGKLIYAGGDDVLAFVSIDDLLPLLFSLRMLYGGLDANLWPGELPAFAAIRKRYRTGKGFVFDSSAHRLYRTMGTRATASAGAVVAHATAPLRLVLTELRKAEREAKEKAGRDAFAVRVLKRSGSADTFVAKWFAADGQPEHAPLRLLMELAGLVSSGGFSRRAVYHVVDWLGQLEGDQLSDLLASNLAWQMARQTDADKLDVAEVRELARRLAGAASAAAKLEKPADPFRWLQDLFIVAEFLGRDGRGAALFGPEVKRSAQRKEAAHG